MLSKRAGVMSWACLADRGDGPHQHTFSQPLNNPPSIDRFYAQVCYKAIYV